MDRKGPMVPRAIKDPQDPRDPKVIQDRKGLEDRKVNLESLAKTTTMMTMTTTMTEMTAMATAYPPRSKYSKSDRTRTTSIRMMTGYRIPKCSKASTLAL